VYNRAVLLPLALGGPVPFLRPFSPLDGATAPVERPYRDDLCLNGNWRFQRAPKELPPPTAAWERTPIRIPSPWNVNAFPVESKEGGDFRCFPSYPAAWEEAQAGWLQRSFAVPKGWRGKQLILRFEAVAGDARVFVNETLVARHRDNFLPFEVDVTDAVRPGAANELRVGVRKASLDDVPGPYGRRTYQGGSMWGQAIAGIWQDVTLKAVPAVRVDDVFVKPDVAAGVLGAVVVLRNDTNAPKTVRLTGDVLPWRNRAGKGILDAPEPKGGYGQKVLSLTAASVTVPAHGTATTRLSARVGGALKTWSPKSPNLYGLVCRLDGDAKLTRFGWRQVAFQDSKVLLNGEPLVMKGDSWHFLGIPQMTRRYAWAWFRALRDANLNAVRLHAQPYPAFYLDMADEMGILVLDETAVWASDGGPKLDAPAYWDDTKRHLGELIRRDRNHPSVFGWSVSNEVMAVVRNVFHAPKAVEERANAMNGEWAAVCRALDPTRAWISADGEDDGHGQLPTYVIHYGDRSTMRRAAASGKPWGVGEAGPAYYGSPKQIAEMADDPRAYLSFENRMRGVAAVSYRSLIDQRDEGASYRSVFNLAWYGLKPLPLGMRDTARPPELSDGVTFGPFREGQPGVQPERLGPYCTTLNPGYDPALPLYQTWPLFDAIRAAQAEPPLPYEYPKTVVDVGVATRAGTIPAVRVLAAGGTMASTLADLGVTVADEAALLFLDGASPPGPEAKALLDAALARGGTVVVWGTRPETLPRLNALLPRPLELTGRTASSLVAAPDPMTAGLAPAALYFSESNPSTVLPGGLDGPLLKDAKVLLRACDTDWRRWNGQGEAVKTAMVLRSEREAKPSGAALAVASEGPGRLIVANLPLASDLSAVVAMDRTILGNLGIALGEGAAGRNLLAPTGALGGYLALGPFDAPSVEAALDRNPVRADSGLAMVAGLETEGRRWTSRLELRDGTSFAYLSLWLYSPKDLTNLLLDPHLPTVALRVTGADRTQIWLDGRSNDSDKPLALKTGWNHLLVKVVRAAARPEPPTLRFETSQPAFLAGMRAAREAPGP